MTAERKPDEEELEKLRRRLDRIGDGQPRRQHPDVVKHGGIAESDADVGDVSRDTYGTPPEPAGTDGPAGEGALASVGAQEVTVADDRRRDDDRLAEEVLGINDGPVNKDSTDIPFLRRDDDQESAAKRRRRADDLAERRPDPGGGPDGMKVQI